MNGFEKAALICWDMIPKHSCILRIVTLLFKSSAGEKGLIGLGDHRACVCVDTHLSVLPGTAIQGQRDSSGWEGVLWSTSTQSCRPSSPTGAWVYFKLFRLCERNLPLAQHKLPGLSCWRVLLAPYPWTLPLVFGPFFYLFMASSASQLKWLPSFKNHVSFKLSWRSDGEKDNSAF